MKHINTFENYKVNELTGSLVNRAYGSARQPGRDKISQTIKNRQGDDFLYYINPDIVTMANNFEFSINKYDQDTIQIQINAKNGDAKYVNVDTNGDYDEDFEPNYYDNITLRKLQKLITAIRNDYNKPDYNKNRG